MRQPADVVLSKGVLKSLLASYQRRAEDAINSYHALSKTNGLHFPRHEEEVAVSRKRAWRRARGACRRGR